MSSKNLIDCCILSLSERVKLIGMEDTRIIISANMLRFIYKKINIRKNTIIKMAASPRKYTLEVLEEMLNDLKCLLVDSDEWDYEKFSWIRVNLMDRIKLKLDGADRMNI